MQTTAETTASSASKATGSYTEQEHYAAGLVIECFGADSAEALRFVQHIAKRNGLPWLTDRAPADAATAEVQA